MTKTNFIVKPTERKIVIERSFDAPRELVFKAYTNPNHIPEWWGPENLTTVVESMELKVGGVWRFIQRDSAGKEYAFSGVYHEIVFPSRLVFSFEFEGMKGHILMQTIKFEETEGRTKITTTVPYQSIQDLEGMLNAGMEKDNNESMDRFAELLAKL